MINTTIIRQALETALSLSVTPVRIAFENVRFVQNTNEIYVESFVLNAKSYNPTMGDAFYRMPVILQANVVAPAGNGTGAASALVDQILAYFKVGLTLLNDSSGRIIVISSPSIGPVLSSDPVFRIPVSITFLCDIHS